MIYLAETLPCLHSDSFVDITFDAAAVIHSNLGFQGGQNGTAHDGLPSTSVPPTILLGPVGRHPGLNVDINLRISNLTEYRAFNAIENNGIKERSNGSFGVVNLLGPQPDRSYRSVDLRFE